VLNRADRLALPVWSPEYLLAVPENSNALYLESFLRRLGSPKRAADEKRYLKSDMEFAGVAVPVMRSTVAAWTRERGGLDHDELTATARALWDRPLFECRAVAVILLERNTRLLSPADTGLIEYLLRHSGTWALVDGLAANVAGVLAERYDLTSTLDRWAADPDFWIRRSAMLALLRPLRRLTPAARSPDGSPETALRPKRVVEISAGPGRYLSALLAAGEISSGHLVRLGRLAGGVAPEVTAAVERGQVVVADDPPAKDFDLCVIANGIHGPAPGDDLGWLLDLIRPGGAVLIDDVFLPPDGGPGSEIGLDWLTHGGITWPRASELTDALVAAGYDIAVDKRLGSTGCHLILAAEG